MTRRVWASLIGGAMIVALFGSGFLLFASPLPVSMLVARRQRLEALGGCLLALAVGGWYAAGLEWVLAWVDRWPGLAAWLPLPGLGLAALLGPVAGGGFTLSYLGYYLLIGWLIGEGFARGWAAVRIVGLATGVAFAAVAATVVGLELIGAVPLRAGFQTYLQHLIDQVVQVAAEGGAAVQMEAMRAMAPQIITAAIRLLPALCWLASLAIAVIATALSRMLLRPYGIGHQLRPMAAWRAPFWLVWTLIGSGIAFFVDRYIVGSGAVAAVALNIVIGILAVEFLQGVAVLQWMVRRWPVGWKWVVYLLCLMWVQIAAPLLAMVGVADAWVDLRRQRNIKQ